MPIYAYRCESCGHAMDVLRKVSDPALTTCPACGAETLRKQVTAAGFQLKGSGWYVTDFRGDSKVPAADAKAGDKAKPANGDAAKPSPAEAAPAAAPSSSETAKASTSGAASKAGE